MDKQFDNDYLSTLELEILRLRRVVKGCDEPWRLITEGRISGLELAKSHFNELVQELDKASAAD